MAYAIVDGDGVELRGEAPEGFDALFDILSDFVQVYVPRHELGERIGDADDRPAELFLAHAVGAPEASGSRHPAARRGDGAFECVFHLSVFVSVSCRVRSCNKVHLHEIGQYVKQRIEALGCFAAEFNTIAVDDGIAMGHDGMLYSLPSRDIIADSVEYMASAHKIDALVCISNCDKITPGMLMAAMRLNIPTVFVSGGPMEAGKFQGRSVDLIDAMVMGADETCSDALIAEIERCACPGCGSCSGMFTANSMNCLTEALGLSLPGNGTIVATHVNRRRLFEDAAALIVRNAERYYFEGDERVLPRSIATKAAFENAMSLDIAMGGSTNTVLHLLAVAHEAGVDFTMQDIDRLSRRVPVLCKVAPNSHYHIQDVNRAGASSPFRAA